MCTMNNNVSVLYEVKLTLSFLLSLSKLITSILGIIPSTELSKFIVTEVWNIVIFYNYRFENTECGSQKSSECIPCSKIRHFCDYLMVAD